MPPSAHVAPSEVFHCPASTTKPSSLSAYVHSDWHLSVGAPARLVQLQSATMTFSTPGPARGRPRCPSARDADTPRTNHGPADTSLHSRDRVADSRAGLPVARDRPAFRVQPAEDSACRGTRAS